jgi:hypothetical protein
LFASLLTRVAIVTGWGLRDGRACEPSDGFVIAAADCASLETALQMAKMLLVTGLSRSPVILGPEHDLGKIHEFDLHAGGSLPLFHASPKVRLDRVPR